MNKLAAPPRKPNSYRYFRENQTLRDNVRHGVNPSNSQVRISGMFEGDDIKRDIIGRATDVIFSREATAFDALNELSNGAITIDLLRSARDACKQPDDRERFTLHLAAAGDHAAVLGEVMIAFNLDFTSVARQADGVYLLLWAVGLLGLGVGRDKPFDSVSQLRHVAAERLHEFERLSNDLRLCVGYSIGLSDDDEPTGEDELFAALRGQALRLVEEDRAEVDLNFVPDEEPLTVLQTKVVVPAFDPMKLPTSRRDQTRSLQSIAGVALPIPAAPDNISAWLAEIKGEYPHLQHTLERIAGYVCQFDSVAGLRILLVGPAGVGKTELAKSIFESLQVPSVVYPCGGAADGSIGGTSSQYGTARPSGVLNAVGTTGCAGAGLVLDEIDKVATGSHNGSMTDALLSFLEPSTAKRLMDPLLEREVDLSAVNYIATCNDLSKVPQPLRDRFRIFDVPAAEWKHIGPLSSSIIRKIEQDRRLQQGMIEDLAGDEISLIKFAWNGGSLRKLRQVIEVMIQTREQMQVRN